LIIHLLNNANSLFLSHFSNILDELLSSSLFITIGIRTLLYDLTIVNSLSSKVIGIQSEKSSYKQETILFTKQRAKNPSTKILYEQVLLWFLKAQRMSGEDNDEVRVHCLDHIVHREVSKKLAEEQAFDNQEEQLLAVPFKMKT